VERNGSRDGRAQIRVIVRNPHPYRAIVIGDIWAKPREHWQLRAQTKAIKGWRIEPRHAEFWDCIVATAEAPKRISR
jgi:hypothetical protein